MMRLLIKALTTKALTGGLREEMSKMAKQGKKRGHELFGEWFSLILFKFSKLCIFFKLFMMFGAV